MIQRKEKAGITKVERHVFRRVGSGLGNIPPPPAATTTGPAVTVVPPESLLVGIFARRNYWLAGIFGHSLAGINVEPAALPKSSMHDAKDDAIDVGNLRYSSVPMENLGPGFNGGRCNETEPATMFMAQHDAKDDVIDVGNLRYSSVRR
nr:hypothetical protein [Tanacetum cinerariifolium]